MRSSGHLHSTTIALVFIFIINTSITLLEGSLFLIGALLLDGDFYISKKIFKIENHRNFPTHSVFLYLILLPLTLLIHSILFWLFAGCFFHLFFDIFDWGLPIIPEKIVTPHLLQVPANKEEQYFFQTYFSNKFIYGIEILFFIGFIVSLFLLKLELVLLALVMELFVVLEFLFQYSKLKKPSQSTHGQ